MENNFNLMMLKYGLQRFADGGEAGGDGGDGGNGGNGGEAGDKGADKDKGADDKPKLYTEEEVNARIDEVVGAKFAKWQKEQEKKISEAEKLAKMNEQERAEHEKAEMQKELEAYKAREALADMKVTARKMLGENKITITDELLDVIVSTDAEETKTAVSAFSKLYLEAVEAGVTERLKGKTPKTGGAGGGTLTKDEIMAIKNPALRKQKIAENIELFK